MVSINGTMLEMKRKNVYIELNSYFTKDRATTEIYTLSLHDALPISTTSRRRSRPTRSGAGSRTPRAAQADRPRRDRDRKSTRLNSSHLGSSYAVFCLKKKRKLA